jgi:RimJ/RimL family protein N-acetyltransferase
MITIEPLLPESYAMAATWLSDPDVNHWLTSEWRGQTVETRMVAGMLRNKRNRLLLVREDGRACGLVGFADLDEADGVAMIWYLLGSGQMGGKGIITAAIGEALRVAFGEYGLHNVYAWIIDGNDRSRRVLLKNGFTEVGRVRLATRLQLRRVDRIYFDITRDDFARRPPVLSG